MPRAAAWRSPPTSDKDGREEGTETNIPLGQVGLSFPYLGGKSFFSGQIRGSVELLSILRWNILGCRHEACNCWFHPLMWPITDTYIGSPSAVLLASPNKELAKTLRVYWESGTSMRGSSMWSTEIVIALASRTVFLAVNLLFLDLTMERPDLHLDNDTGFYGKAYDFYRWRQLTQQLKGASWGHIWTRALELKRELTKWKTRKYSKCSPKLKRWMINTRK